jgi:hypothetical protein
VSLPGADYRGETHSFQAQVDPPSTAAPAGSVSEKDETNNESPPITVRFP